MNKKKLVLAAMTLIFILPSFFGNVAQADVEPYFSVNFLTPNTSSARVQFSLLMETLLPEIGIAVNTNEITGWGNIIPRLDYIQFHGGDHIPTYEEGGFDIFIYEPTLGFDWNPTGLFDTESLPPDGDNIYQYSNPTYDALLESYLTESNPTTKTSYAHQLQSILHDDLPSIVVCYSMGQFGESIYVDEVDELLLAYAMPRYEYWYDFADDMMKYAIPSDFREPNPYYLDSSSDRLWMEAVYGTLYKRAQYTREWEPQIAAGMISTTNGLDITVEINPDAKFSDGSYVLAEDIEYTYELYLGPDLYAEPTAHVLHDYFASNDSITATDTRTITFNLTQECPYLYDLLSYQIIDKSEVEPAIANYGLSIFQQTPFTGDVGDTLVKSCGPFVLNSWSSSKAVLVPNPYYSDIGHNPGLTGLQIEYVSSKSSALSKLEAGDIDIISSWYNPSIEDLNITGVRAVNFTSTGYLEMSINLKHPYLGTGESTPVGTPEAAKYIRKAISHLIPRDQYINDTLGKLGIPGVTACTPTHNVFDDSLQPYEHSIELAREFMRKAGYGVTQTSYEGLSILILLAIGIASIVKAKKNGY